VFSGSGFVSVSCYYKSDGKLKIRKDQGYNVVHKFFGNMDDTNIILMCYYELFYLIHICLFEHRSIAQKSLKW
jgi:hypothetical protein